MTKELPDDIEKRLQMPYPEGGYWEDWVLAIAYLGRWDEQLDNLRNAGHLGALDGENTIYRKDLS